MGNNHLIHFDLVVTDTGEAATFYEEIFSWTVGTPTPPQDYRSVTTGDDPSGGIMKGTSVFARPYFMVDSIQEIIDKITGLNGIGGSVIQGIRPHPKGGDLYFAVIADPHGAQIGLMQHMETSGGSSPD